MADKRDTLDRLFSAIAFAEAGEPEIAHARFRAGRRVLLVTESDARDRNTLTYAVNICKRAEASLNILYPSPAGKTVSAVQHVLCDMQRQGIPCSANRAERPLAKAIVDYTRSHAGVVVVVMGAKTCASACSTKHGRWFRDVWRQLSCPLVVVDE